MAEPSPAAEDAIVYPDDVIYHGIICEEQPTYYIVRYSRSREMLILVSCYTEFKRLMMLEVYYEGLRFQVMGTVKTLSLIIKDCPLKLIVDQMANAAYGYVVHITTKFKMPDHHIDHIHSADLIAINNYKKQLKKDTLSGRELSQLMKKQVPHYYDLAQFDKQHNVENSIWKKLVHALETVVEFEIIQILLQCKISDD